MSNPVNCFIVPDSGLPIIITKKPKKNLIVDFSGVLEYTITLESEDLQFDGSEDFPDVENELYKHYTKGVISPLSKISLPPHAKEKAGIPHGAKYYAYVYPPPKLCRHFDNFDFGQDASSFLPNQDERDEQGSSQQHHSPLRSSLRSSDNYNSVPIDDDDNRRQQQKRQFCTALFSVCGAFIYFDENLWTLSVNTISFLREQGIYKSLSLSGPFSIWDTSEIEYMAGLGRIQALKTELVRESGFIAYGWQRPSESFKKGRGDRTNGQDVVHGGFIFYRDDGTGVRYLVTRDREKSYEYPRGDFESSLADAFGVVSGRQDKISFASTVFDCYDFRELKSRVSREVNDNDFPNFHRALRCKKEPKEIKEMGKDYIITRDRIGWTALHYACRFYADNPIIIKYLVEEKFSSEEQLKSLNVRDDCYRYPLHIACDSHASIEVIVLLLALPLDSVVLNYLSPDSLLESNTRAEALLSNYSFGNLSIKDSDINENEELKELGWNYLHYVCRFHAQSLEFIQAFTSNELLQMNVPDKFGRYPLQIARCNNASEEVIQLLEAISLGSDFLLTQKTKHLQLLPIHIACNRGASFDVIKALLSQDEVRGSIRIRTKAGRLPLHLAIGKKMPHNIIELLLDVERRYDVHTMLKAEESNRYLVNDLLDRRRILENHGIHQYYDGMLPLHMACLNGLETRTIKLLVKEYTGRDYEQSEVSSDRIYGSDDYEPSHDHIQSSRQEDTQSGNSQILRSSSDHTNVSYHDNVQSSRENGMSFSKSEKHSLFAHLNEELLPRRYKFLKGMRALNLCLFQDTDDNMEDTVRFLLEQEQCQNNTIGRDDEVERTKRAIEVDINKRTCLHLACRKNVNTNIIKAILALDPFKDAVKMKDKNGSTPLHLACHNKNAKKDIIQELLDAEIGGTIERTEKIFDNFGRSPGEIFDNLGRSPFNIAVKARAPVPVLKLFLQCEYFDISGFGDREINELARRIKDDTELQMAINTILSQRLPFAIFAFYLIINFGILALFLIGCEQFLSNKEIGSNSSNDFYIFYLETGSSTFNGLYMFCLFGFFMREILQILSERWNYLIDVQNLFEIPSIGLLIRSIIIFNSVEKVPPRSDTVLAFTTLFLIVNLIYFLRNTWKPFSQFAGGLIVILRTLVPYFLVSCLLLFIFSHSLSLTLMDRDAGGSDDEDDTLKGVCATGQQIACFKSVLNVFFGGGRINSETQTFVDIAFGAIVLLVLLNVNIAIVSDAWGDAKSLAIDMYWRGRLSYLGEINVITQLTRLMKRRHNLKKPKWLKQIDEVKGLNFRGPKCSWSKDYPYNIVWDKDEYEHPERYFPQDIAETIKRARSIRSDIYWFKRNETNSETSGLCKMVPTLVCFQIPIGYWIRRFLQYSLLIVVGTCTFGFFLPQRARLWAVWFGTPPEGSFIPLSRDEAERTTMQDDTPPIEQMQPCKENKDKSKIEELQSEIKSMKEMLEEMKFLLEQSKPQENKQNP